VAIIETRQIETSFGIVPVTGDFGPTRRALAITGMRAPPDEMERFPDVVGPAFGGLVAHLPGHSAPPLRETSLAAFAAAFDEVADTLGISVVMGMSVGALVALSMRSPLIKAVVAAEPPLETAKLWQLVGLLKGVAAENPVFYREVLGFEGDSLLGRNYLYLLDGLTRPTAFVVGGLLPFPAREADRFLSVVDEAQRLLIQRSPNATLHVGPKAGHAVHRQSAGLLSAVVRAACKTATGDAEPTSATGS
jgi:pimeloyl-ACP methyl ester carboxylesterase